MSMVINVGKIRSNVGAKVDFRFQFSNEELPELNWNLGSNCMVEGTIENKKEYLLLTAQITGQVQTVCDRCLKEMELPLEGTMEEKLVYVLNMDHLKHLPLDEVEEEYTIFRKDAFDLSDLLQENLLRILPSKVLCKEDCRGLCPKCGQNLNEGECNCQTKKIDPRFAILAKLTEEIEEV